MDLPPDYTTQSHDESDTGQQELYVALRGSGAVVVRRRAAAARRRDARARRRRASAACSRAGRTGCACCASAACPARRTSRPRGPRRPDTGGVTGDEAQRLFATARVARLATAGADGRPHLVPLVFAPRRRRPLQRRRPQAEAHDRAAAARQRAREPARVACWPTTTTTPTGRRCGGCGRTGRRGCSTTASRRPMPRPRAARGALRAVPRRAAAGARARDPRGALVGLAGRLRLSRATRPRRKRRSRSSGPMTTALREIGAVGVPGGDVLDVRHGEGRKS